MKEHLVDASRGYSGSRRLCFSCYGPQSSVMSHGYPQSRESVRCSFHEQHKRIIIINHQSRQKIWNKDRSRRWNNRRHHKNSEMWISVEDNYWLDRGICLQRTQRGRDGDESVSFLDLWACFYFCLRGKKSGLFAPYRHLFYYARYLEVFWWHKNPFISQRQATARELETLQQYHFY